MTMTLIARTDVTSSSNLSYTFSSIPQTYTDLLIISTNQSSGAAIDSLFVRINGDTGSNYGGILFRWTQGIGTDGGYISNNQYFTCVLSPGTTSYSSIYGGNTLYFPNYVNSSTAKGWNVKGGSSTAVSNSSSTSWIASGQWTGTAAITSITLSGYGLYPTSNTTFSLYGIS
jgi:hypothetical protein